MLARIKKDDLVAVVSGRDKGKEGTVVSIDQFGKQALVKGIGMVTCHVKARRQGEKSRIETKESNVPLCKIVPVCPSCKKPCRVQTQVGDASKAPKVRACHRCKKAF